MIHRHLEIPPGTPIAELPAAALHDLLERGDLSDWRPVLAAIADDPHGEITGRVARLVDVYPMYGTSPLLRAWIERCRNRNPPIAPGERRPSSLSAVRRKLGKTQEEVAGAMGISQSDYSKLERRSDVRVSTLRSATSALGGRLALTIEGLGAPVEIELGGTPALR